MVWPPFWPANNVAGASRAPIKEEMEIASTRHIELKDYIIGHYSVAVIRQCRKPGREPTRDQIRDIFTGTVKNWKRWAGRMRRLIGLSGIRFREPTWAFVNSRWKANLTD